MDPSNFEFFKGLFLKENDLMKKFHNLLLVPPEMNTGEDKSPLVKSFLLQDILKEEFQRQNFKIAHLSLIYIEIFLSKNNNPHQNLNLLQYAAMSMASKSQNDDLLGSILTEITCSDISMVNLGRMEFKILNILGYQPNLVTFTDFLLAFGNISPTLTEMFDSTNFEQNIQAFYFTFVQKYGIFRFKSSSLFFICIREFVQFYGFELLDFELNFLDIEKFDKEEIENCYSFVMERLNSFLYSHEEAVPMANIELDHEEQKYFNILGLEGVRELQSDKSEDDDDNLLLCHEKLTFE